jgi:hypothetical protein
MSANTDTPRVSAERTIDVGSASGPDFLLAGLGKLALDVGDLDLLASKVGPEA